MEKSFRKKDDSAQNLVMICRVLGMKSLLGTRDCGLA
jgi:hypothetical protein